MEQCVFEIFWKKQTCGFNVEENLNYDSNKKQAIKLNMKNENMGHSHTQTHTQLEDIWSRFRKITI